MKTFRGFLMDLALVSASIGIAFLIVWIVLACLGHPRILWDWLIGGVGTWADVLIVLRKACPLILTGLAAGIAFRSGVFNIGAEGQSVAGAILTVWLATRLCPGLPGPVAIPGALLAAAIGGALWALVPAAMDRFRGVPIVLSTILLNFIAIQLLELVLEHGLRTTQPSSDVQSDPLPGPYWLPVIVPPSVGSLHAGILIALGLAVLCWVVQARTRYGFEILVTGLNPVAARYAGMPVAARQFGVMLWSGAFAGLAGGVQLMGVEGGHSLGRSPALYGYAGIAVALLGGLHPMGVVCAALFFAALDNGATALDSPQFPHEIADIVKAFIILLVLAGSTFTSRIRQKATEH